MAEPKSVVLLSAPKSAGSEQKSKKPARSLRFELTLQETTKETYSEFSYLDLVSKEKVCLTGHTIFGLHSLLVLCHVHVMLMLRILLQFLSLLQGFWCVPWCCCSLALKAAMFAV